MTEEVDPSAGSPPRKRVLLVDPVVFVHSTGHYRAALASTGFEDAEFTLVTTTGNEAERNRIEAFAREHPRITLRPLGVRTHPVTSRVQSWRNAVRVMKAVDALLSQRRFDLVAYLHADNTLPFFAFPGLCGGLPGHRAHHVGGLIFLHNGLRPTRSQSWKSGLRDRFDRWILGRAMRKGALRKFAFFDHVCCARAAAAFGADRCEPGVDPIFIESRDAAAARRKLGVDPSAFIALMFGAISDRKGIVDLLQILHDHPISESALLLLITGPVSAEFRPKVEKAIEAARIGHRVDARLGFVPDEDVADYFAAADCVVCPYKDFNASSGVLLHAASHGKPALVSPGGVMEDAVTRHGFGAVIRLNEPPQVSAALARLIQMNGPDRQRLSESALAYARSMDARRYLGQFLNSRE